MSKKLEVRAVGAIGERVVYVQFFKDDEAMPNQLWKLTHPGNLAVEKWNDSVLKIEDEKTEISRIHRTKEFFRNCVAPVSDATPGVPLELELVEEFGKNASPKPDPDSIHPKLYGAWQKLREKFLSGDIWDDLDESGRADNSESVKVKGKDKTK